jgi:hypothetical protein
MANEPSASDGFIPPHPEWSLFGSPRQAVARERLVQELMTACRAIRSVRDNPEALARVRTQVDAAKRALGERGPF